MCFFEYKLTPLGLFPQAYLTATGFEISELQTTILLSLITAFAQTNFLLAPAIAKCFKESCPFTCKYFSFENVKIILLPFTRFFLNVGK